jgi:hypothetical protein
MRIRTTGALLVLAVGVVAAAGLAQETAPPATAPPATDDPRVGLAPGFRDAGQALWNMELVTTLPRPAGFFDAQSPAGIPMPPRPATPPPAPDSATDAAPAAGEAPAAAPAAPAAGEAAEAAAAPAPAARPSRSILGFANTDLAFRDNHVLLGSYYGVNLYDIEDPEAIRHVASMICPGGQGDVSIYGDLLFMSVQETRARLDCGTQGVEGEVSDERFRGVRIFDVSDLRMPRQVAAVQTCRGSHTHTIVNNPGEEGTLYLYNSGTSSVRPGEELAGCSDADPGEDPNSALFSIDVIEVPLAAPEQARVVSSPRIFADAETGAIAGLWSGGDHGEGTQRTSTTNQCHDITVYPDIGLAAGACSGNGILLDVSDPANPVRLDAATDPNFAYWHSATFNNDGTKVIFTDEWGGGTQPRCRATDPPAWGANAIFDIVDGKLQFRGYYKLPAPQTDQENCVAHNGSLLPVPGRDIMVQAWYQGGTTVFDFTDPTNPVEIAFFDRGPIDADNLIVGGHWSTYWYNGLLYGSEISRGLDVLRLTPSEHLSASELEAADQALGHLQNAQQQRRVTWPATPAVARAYVDQLERSGALDTESVGAMRSALAAAQPTELGQQADLAEAAAGRAVGHDAEILQALASTLRGIGAE